MMANHIISIRTGAAIASTSSRRTAQFPAPEDLPMPEYVRNYHPNSQTVGEFFAAQERRLKAMSTHRSPTARQFLLAEEASETSRFVAEQSRRQAALESIRSGFATKLDRVGARKKVSVVVFSVAAAFSAAAAAVNATSGSERPASAAAAAAASILLVALGKWIDSLLEKSESGVMKHMEVIRAMVVGGKFTIKGLTEIYAMAQGIKYEAESISKMVDDGATDVDLGNKMAALDNSLERLGRKVSDGSLNACSSTESVQRRILKNFG